MSTGFTEAAPPILHLLAHDIRWNLTKALARSDYRVGELVTLLHKPFNLVSYHLRQLRDGALVHERRSAADGRDLYYSLDLAHVERVYALAGETLHPGLGDHSPLAAAPTDVAAQPPTRVLFLCTHNSARSQMAEAILRHLGGDQVAVFSAGTEQTQVHPAAVHTLAQHGIDASGQTSKQLSLFTGQTFDYVITVCDRARETCPVFPGDPERIHWSFADPALIADPEDQRRAFELLYVQLHTRLRYLLTLIARKRGGV